MLSSGHVAAFPPCRTPPPEHVLFGYCNSSFLRTYPPEEVSSLAGNPPPLGSKLTLPGAFHGLSYHLYRPCVKTRIRGAGLKADCHTRGYLGLTWSPMFAVRRFTATHAEL